MIIAISSKNNDENSEIDERLGRCEYFLFFEIKEENNSKNNNITFLKSMKNIYFDKPSAGIGVVKFLKENKVDVVITGSVGPNALELFKQFKIKAYQYAGTKNESIQKYISNELKRIA